jgi:hypothetical protein
MDQDAGAFIGELAGFLPIPDLLDFTPIEGLPLMEGPSR